MKCIYTGIHIILYIYYTTNSQFSHNHHITITDEDRQLDKRTDRDWQTDGQSDGRTDARYADKEFNNLSTSNVQLFSQNHGI